MFYPVPPVLRRPAPLIACLAGLMLAACQPQSPAAPVTPAAKPAAAPLLNEREPDSCKAKSLGHLIGKPAGNLRTVRLAGASRIIPPGGIVSQEDYDASRINALIDQSGLITRLECG